MKILSCGAGMQSTALALMSCENKMKGIIHKEVPIYDAVIFCDLGLEPYWVNEQVDFIENACKKAGIPFHKIESNLYKDYMERFGEGHVSSVPFWSVDENGKKAKMRRHCTIDYKILLVEKFLRYNLLGYKISFWKSIFRTRPQREFVSITVCESWRERSCPRLSTKKR